ncbi:MAG: hypothetical protein ACJAZP_002742 [Psychromonas sp.]|jgi:hypothetical protein|uniref:hypothetical protein n=1 Tax=Psychromonas sp. TaxID=1884585 RepID=UPI0039E414E8
MEIDEKSVTIQLKIDKNKLMKLSEQGVICAADFKCIDPISKQLVMQLCLKNCAKRMQINAWDIPIILKK